MASTTFQKRAKETLRRDNAKAKEQRRQERKQERGPRVVGPDGEDPDIAGIIPGPQPILEDED